jgi:hypothetical protein
LLHLAEQKQWGIRVLQLCGQALLDSCTTIQSSQGYSEYQLIENLYFLFVVIERILGGPIRKWESFAEGKRGLLLCDSSEKPTSSFKTGNIKSG